MGVLSLLDAWFRPKNVEETTVESGPAGTVVKPALSEHSGRIDRWIAAHPVGASRIFKMVMVAMFVASGAWTWAQGNEAGAGGLVGIAISYLLTVIRTTNRRALGWLVLVATAATIIAFASLQLVTSGFIQGAVLGVGGGLVVSVTNLLWEAVIKANSPS